MTELKPDEIDWGKMAGLVPAIVQDERTGEVLMLGFMNEQAFEKTLESGKVTFWSRTRKTLWTKGETSGHYLHLRSIQLDCDQDTLLVQAVPEGPVCHRQTRTCFSDDPRPGGLAFLDYLERLIERREKELPEGSYTTRLFQEGSTLISKKLGEEAVEVIVSANQSRERTVEESADLIYHLLVFLRSRGVALAEVLTELEKRHR
ncbi:MAG: bifunctional phosphoribosyl-AMP cyclohydrolase/phosphoribosyl-ATP diphosphatase HisIE [Acidobacteriota bacterium]|nr:MAG: bifunctional phosphoribosyl-AMP cyclohydrolase/phosphoribosyl-ATP diphosphatase HisIE [Acidobacteriota bacterium]